MKFKEFRFVSYEESLQYGRNQENRLVDHSHLTKLKSQVETAHEAMPPITVNPLTNHIIDGQHRLEAYQRLIEDGKIPNTTQLKVMFVEMTIEEENEEIAQANLNSKNWSLDNFIARFIKRGVKDYVELQSWCENHTLTYFSNKSKYRYGAAIIKGRGCSKELRDGLFTVTEEELKAAEETHKQMTEIIKLFNLKGNGAWIEALAVSWNKHKGFHTFKDWMRGLKRQKSTLMKKPMSNMKEWDTIFSLVHTKLDSEKIAA